MIDLNLFFFYILVANFELGFITKDTGQSSRRGAPMAAIIIVH